MRDERLRLGLKDGEVEGAIGRENDEIEGMRMRKQERVFVKKTNGLHVSLFPNFFYLLFKKIVFKI